MPTGARKINLTLFVASVAIRPIGPPTGGKTGVEPEALVFCNNRGSTPVFFKGPPVSFLRRLSPYVLGMYLLFSIVVVTRAENGLVDSGKVAAIDRVVAAFVANRDFMGVVAIQRDGEPALILPYGLASVELDAPHGPDDIFMIGSVSKQFTAAAILLLEQEGKLKVSDLVSFHLEGFKPDEKLTIEQLLVHTSGVADVYSLKRFGQTNGQAGSLTEIVADLGRMNLTHPAGSAFAYSNGGYALLSAIIEKVSGMGYGAFLHSRIFLPLGMTRTSHDQPGPVVKGRVQGYNPWGRDSLTAVIPVAEAYTTGSGSIWSSAADLLTWSDALHDGRLLSAASYAKLTTDYGYGYGYGVSVFRRFGRDVIGHDGRVAGYASDLARYIDERTTVVILSNVESVARDEIRRSVAAIVFDEPVAQSKARAFAEHPPESIDELLGVYSFGPNFEVSISESDGRLLARANEGGFSELVPMSDGTWFSRMLYASVRFQKNEQGIVDRLIWGPGDSAPIGNRTQ